MVRVLRGPPDTNCTQPVPRPSSIRAGYMAPRVEQASHRTRQHPSIDATIDTTIQHSTNRHRARREQQMARTPIVYFSSVSENTKRFVDRLGIPATRIPLRPSEPHLQIRDPYVLIVPTYGGGNGRGAVPKQVIRFLNDPHNRGLIRGVVAAGNTNFGSAYCIAGNIVSAKCGVPHLYNFELLGTSEDVTNVRAGMERQWLQP